MFRNFMLGASVALVAAVLAQPAAGAGTVRIALIEGLSGPFASVGQAALRELQFAADRFINGQNVAGGIAVEVIGLDGKGNPQDSLVQMQNAIGQGATYIVQGNSSGVAHAIIDAVNKHNERNPDRRVLFLNHSAVDPALTNEKCSFWHFRFDGNADMKMNAITETIRQDRDTRKVYIIGQDYSFGKAVSAAAREYLARKRPDIEIVGDELHPIGKVKDFTPYVQKIQASGADAIITGNWGADMVNLAKAVNDVGVKARMYTFYASGSGITATIGAAGKDSIYVVTDGHRNPTVTDAWEQYRRDFRAKFPDVDLIYPRMAHLVQMLARAFDEAGSTDPVAVARALEGMEATTLAGDRVRMRAEDHQLLMPLQIAVHTDEGVVWDYDRSGFGLVTRVIVPAEENMTETTCRMERP